MQNKIDIASKSLKLSEHYLSKGKPGRSFAHLLLALKLIPDWRDNFKAAFSSTLCEWGNRLESEGRYADLFICYEQGLEIYPNSEVILNDLGSYLFRLQYLREARQYFIKSFAVDENYLQAYKNLQNVSNAMVDKWHFKMLNDHERNDAFRRAISKSIKNGLSIIDIGTGTGILSLYAVSAGAKNVFACDYSKTMASIAEEIFNSNLEPNSIKLINKLSTSMTIPEDIPFRCSLVVTETADAGLLGEHMLQTLVHAWESLLTKHNAKVIPRGAKLYAVPIECLKIARECILLPKERRSCSNLTDLFNANLSYSNEEPYDTENLKRCDFKPLSQAIEIFNFNFESLEDLKDHLEGKKNRNNVIFKCEDSGYLDAIAIWFELFLDEEIVISTSPRNNTNCCWDQAVFTFPNSNYIESETSISVNVSCTDGKLKVQLNEIDHPNCQIKPSLYTSKTVIKYLNSISFLKTLESAVKTIISLDRDLTNVLDLSAFPYAGLLFSQLSNAIITSYNEIGDDLKIILKNLNVDLNRFTSKLRSDFVTCKNRLFFDVIIVDLLDSTGQFNDVVLTELPNIRQENMLKPNGIILPNKINLWCQLVYSSQLSNEFEVSETNLHTNYKIAEFINEYKTNTHIDLNMTELNFEELSEQICFGNLEYLESDTKTIEKTVKAIKSGEINAIIYWYSYEVISDISFSTAAKDSHINQNAEMLDTKLNVNRNDEINLNCIFNASFVKFSINY